MKFGCFLGAVLVLTVAGFSLFDAGYRYLGAFVALSPELACLAWGLWVDYRCGKQMGRK